MTDATSHSGQRRQSELRKNEAPEARLTLPQAEKQRSSAMTSQGYRVSGTRTTEIKRKIRMPLEVPVFGLPLS